MPGASRSPVGTSQCTGICSGGCHVLARQGEVASAVGEPSDLGHSKEGPGRIQQVRVAECGHRRPEVSGRCGVARRSEALPQSSREARYRGCGHNALRDVDVEAKHGAVAVGTEWVSEDRSSFATSRALDPAHRRSENDADEWRSRHLHSEERCSDHEHREAEPDFRGVVLVGAERVQSDERGGVTDADAHALCALKSDEGQEEPDAGTDAILNASWEEPDHQSAQAGDAEQDEDAGRDEDSGERGLPGQASAENDAEGEKGVGAHTWCQHEWVVRQHTHQDATDACR
mmetsp:Transcript_79772/g.258428  ORF Transcript_79772/g.258428 Transcript_79772/m.258428 type:complete len:288 (-) Transcript_79772:304-1167(-)